MARYPSLPGKEGTPWKTAGKGQHKKKFSYKDRTNKIPLRDRIKQEEEDKLIALREKEIRTNANKMLAERMKKEREQKELQNRTRQPKGILKKEKDEIKKDSDYVTLTQNQLETILSSIAKVQGTKHPDYHVEVEDPQHLRLTMDQGSNATNSERPSRETSDQVSSQELESILNLAKKAKTVGDTSHETQGSRKEKSNPADMKQVASRSDVKVKVKKQVVLDIDLDLADKDKSGRERGSRQQDKSLKKSTKPDEDDNERELRVFTRQPAKVVVLDDQDESAKVQNENPRTVHELVPDVTKEDADKTKNEMSPRQKQLLIPRSHMTKAELIRLQREIENSDNSVNAKSNNHQRLDKTSRQSPLNANSTSHNDNARYAKTNSKKVVVEPDFVPGLGGIPDSNSGEALNSTYTTQKFRENDSSALKISQNLSVRELKRLQWEKERANALPEYNPWGKPGAGVGPNLHDTVWSSPRVDDNVSTVENSGANLPSKKLPKRFQEPTVGVPTSIPGLGNPIRDPKPSIPEPIKPSLTKAQLLRLKWAEERADALQDYNPFGKPGAGAPIRSDSGTALTSYQSRLHVLRNSIGNQEDVKEVHAAAESTIGNSVNNSYVEPVAVPGLDVGGTVYQELNSSQKSSDGRTEGLSRNHIRGQLANIDPVTLKEREEQRRKELRYQEEIRRQVEEKQKIKREEELKKMKEDVEHEERMRAQLNNQEKQTERKRERNQEKVAKDVSRVDIVAEAMKRAKEEAELLKARKRLEKLKAAGHDITNLKAAYEEKFSPRVGPVIKDMLSSRQGDSVPALQLETLSSRANNTYPTDRESVAELQVSPRYAGTKATSRSIHDNQQSSRMSMNGSFNIVTNQKENFPPMKESGIQTETPEPGQAPFKSNKQVRVISGSKDRKPRQKQEPRPWGWKNQAGKKFTGQSRKDPFYDRKQREKEERHQARREFLLRQVEANIQRLPNGKTIPSENKSRPVNNRSRSPASEMNKEKQVVMNSYISPRYKIANNSSPRTNEESTKPPTHQAKRSTSRPGYIAPGTPIAKGLAKSLSESKKSKQGYDLNVAQNLRVTPIDDEYVPFTRSDAVLSPSHAQDPSPMSREATQAALAREAYYKNMQPAHYGVHMHNIKDPVVRDIAPSHNKDPLYNPSVITKHPTERQQQVLDSLRQIRQGLLAKQKEIESYSDQENLADDQET